MKRRLYFLLPDVNSTRETVDELLLAHVEFGRMHVIANESISLDGLPEASLLQKSDVVHGFESGMIIGGLIGLFAGFVVMFFQELSSLGGWSILGCLLAGTAIGAWVSSMIGSDVRNTRLKAFDSAIAEGQILLMVDVPNSMTSEITRLVNKNHPEGHSEGMEPTIPAFP
ncbi:MAG: DUF1269 domain-containing protein [Gammaproteobacteria bacterium]|nr:DUF1269 domain-containing protein [Gammaproteobacteria bacterium]